MNKELILILKELKKLSELGENCLGTKFIDFSCIGIACHNCILTSRNAEHRYSSQIVLVRVNYE